MFSLSDNLQYYLCTGATDMRKGFDTLCGVVRSQMGRDPLSGEVFIFVNRARSTIKLLHWESGGLVLYHKRLESGGFERPTYDEKQNSFQMKWSELVMMIEGLSMKNIVQRKRFVSTLVTEKEDEKRCTKQRTF
jgi:transposase